MKSSSLRKQILSVIIFALCTVVLSISAWSSGTPQKAAEGRRNINKLRVSVLPQEDAPIVIKIFKADAADPQQPDVEFHITNNSGKAIRAYAIRHDILYSHRRSGSVTLTNIATAESIFKPGEARIDTVYGIPRTSESVERIVLAVDYVEFLDGTNWGPDIYKSADRLAGQRAGAQAAAEFFNKLFDSRGTQAVIEACQSNSGEITPQPGRSNEWLDGFRSGKDSFLTHLKRIVKEGKLGEIQSQLRKPFDLSKGIDR